MRYQSLHCRSRRQAVRIRAANWIPWTPEAAAMMPHLFPSDITPDEAEAGFALRAVEHPDGAPSTVPAVVLAWGDPSHRLVKTRGRDGQIVFQLQAFGRARTRAGSAGWTAERYWPGRYGPAWVLERLREHVGRPEYAALVELHDPTTGDGLAAAASPGADEPGASV